LTRMDYITSVKRWNGYRSPAVSGESAFCCAIIDMNN